MTKHPLMPMSVRFFSGGIEHAEAASGSYVAAGPTLCLGGLAALTVSTGRVDFTALAARQLVQDADYHYCNEQRDQDEDR